MSEGFGGMAGQKQIVVRTKKALLHLLRRTRALRTCFRPGPDIPRWVAPQQSPTPFLRTIAD